MIFDTNITTDSTVDLITIGSNAGSIGSIYITNKASAEVNVDVYFDNGSGTTSYLVKNTTVPTGVALLLTDNVSFSNSNFGLKITVLASTSTPDVDVLIR